MSGRNVLTQALRELLDRLRDRTDPPAAALVGRVSVQDGLAVVDFHPFQETSLAWASTSCGGSAMWGMLNKTVFQFASVRAVRYRFDGNCEAFQEFMQSACINGHGLFTRAEWEGA